MLYIAGINHFDPLGRRNLVKWLKDLARSCPGPPRFVAVEWGEKTFSEVVAQRPALRQHAEQLWPTATPHFLDTLMLGMGFEGDTHLEVLQGVETLWLDEWRVVDRSDIEHYAENRMRVYQSLLPKRSIGQDSQTLIHMSKEAWSRAESLTHGGSRDAKFASRLIEYLVQREEGWAIAVVGSNHASTAPGYMGSLVKERGTQCAFSVLKP